MTKSDYAEMISKIPLGNQALMDLKIPALAGLALVASENLGSTIPRSGYYVEIGDKSRLH